MEGRPEGSRVSVPGRGLTAHLALLVWHGFVNPPGGSEAPEAISTCVLSLVRSGVLLCLNSLRFFSLPCFLTSRRPPPLSSLVLGHPDTPTPHGVFAPAPPPAWNALPLGSCQPLSAKSWLRYLLPREAHPDGLN